nr:MAG: hypothetical protein [Bacteriophage sp.]
MENFFKISNSIDLVEVEELLLSRYSNLDYILNLGFYEGYEIILKAYKKELEDKAWDRWLVDYRNMTKDNFISFEEYKDKLFTTNIVQDKYLTKEELLKEAAEIERKITSKKRGD